VVAADAEVVVAVAVGKVIVEERFVVEVNVE